MPIPDQTIPDQHDQTVRVSFSPPDEKSWIFDPRVVRMTDAGKIILLRDPHSPEWTFVRVNGLPDYWDIWINPNGRQVVITDPHKPMGEFVYTVTVRYEDCEYTSPETQAVGESGNPPIIMNE